MPCFGSGVCARSVRAVSVSGHTPHTQGVADCNHRRRTRAVAVAIAQPQSDKTVDTPAETHKIPLLSGTAPAVKAGSIDDDAADQIGSDFDNGTLEPEALRVISLAAAAWAFPATRRHDSVDVGEGLVHDVKTLRWKSQKGGM